MITTEDYEKEKARCKKLSKSELLDQYMTVYSSREQLCTDVKRKNEVIQKRNTELWELRGQYGRLERARVSWQSKCQKMAGDQETLTNAMKILLREQ